ncbi:hypothetical protein BK127_40980 [Paenibacillus sp. FSL H7-0331]|nr:hypothetical protein BK127_40980 [Paenibacillus sp. FSL H7-0331]
MYNKRYGVPPAAVQVIMLVNTVWELLIQNNKEKKVNNPDIRKKVYMACSDLVFMATRIVRSI